MSKKSRREVIVNPKKFATYALAGAAAVVGAETVDADITYVSDINALVSDLVVDTTGATYQLYFGDAGSARLDFYHYLQSEPPRFGFAVGGGQVLSTNATAVVPGVSVAGLSSGGSNYISNVAAGAAISALPGGLVPGSNPGWLDVSGTFAYGGGYANSQWQSSGVGFIAVRWDNDGAGPNGFSYGWVRVATEGVSGNGLVILDQAWADPGEALAVGQVPEPGSLGCLALGAVGLISWRRRRRAA